MPLSTVDLFTYGIALLIIGGVVWWVLAAWVPEGGLRAPYKYAAYQSGLTRRQTVPAALLSLLILVPLATKGGDISEFAWVIAAGLYIGGLYIGVIAVANRPRADYIEQAGGDPDELTPDGSNIVAGTAAVPDGEAPLEAPVSGDPAVCYVTSVAQYKSRPMRSSGTYFITAYDVETQPFDVDGAFGTASVDPEGAWVSLVSGSPTDVEPNVEGAFTGGPAETEQVVEAGERVPERFRTTDVFDPLPLTSDGRAERELRFKETTITPGESVVVAGEAEQGEGFGETVLRCTTPGTFIAKGDFESVATSLSKATSRNLAVGGGLALFGGIGLLWMVIP
ncbi:hypothetical protein HWV23_01845 [Natronomonas halophila]|uniref:hypothetical protein n=1 Tax=Natronomonas halophila TaxID=2747817 RepID=UPI0015B67266|nr:hypothetical protein [Natronomonas halophila]QLD84500.1 hypothetical protein HWV23_01845 [Natronomonas halophila]